MFEVNTGTLPGLNVPSDDLIQNNHKRIVIIKVRPPEYIRDVR
jgi:hypothetical protein